MCACLVQPEAVLDPKDAQVLESFRQHTPASRNLPLPPESKRRKSRYILESPASPFLRPGQVAHCLNACCPTDSVFSHGTSFCLWR